MRKYYTIIFTLFGMAVSQAQIVNIPDANFKARLLASGPTDGVARDANDQYLVVDTNSNGEIEVSEALPVRKLEIPGDEIADLTGIAAFVNLTDLNINNNYLTNLDVSMLTQLEWLLADFNQLTSISVGPALTFLGCGNNQLTSLDLSNCNTLENIHCNNNQLAALDLSNQPDLHTIFCFRNELTNLNIANSPSLNTIWCSENALTGIDLSDAPVLSWLECYDNPITSLDLSSLALPEGSIFFLFCSNNSLSFLDLSGADARVMADCSNNPDLAYINCLDTGTFYDPNAHEPPFPGLSFENLPNLTHICADPINYDYLNAKIAMYGYTNVTVDVTCTLGQSDFAAEDPIVVYPNPAGDRIEIKSLKSSTIDSVVIYDVLGQVVLETQQTQQPISVAHLTSGHYWIRVISKNGIANQKLMKL